MGFSHENNENEIEKLKEELALVKDVLGNLITWCGRELGQNVQKSLMDRLYPDAENAINECEHDFVSADNEAMKGGEICTKCHAVQSAKS